VPSQFVQAVTRAAYGVRQLPRVAWYIGHSLVLRELADTARQSEKSNSAELYDTQVEVLFNGSANAIRRQALPQLHEVFAGRDQRKLSLMDVGCGTGRFFDSAKQVWPRLPIFGIDMSEAYVKFAKGHLKHWSQIKLSDAGSSQCRGGHVGKAEALPVRDQSQDDLTSIFVFHELPPKVRRSVFRANVRAY
jgi:ubiquinone/menaquinone biosynthesis C-methylase UbiE